MKFWKKVLPFGLAFAVGYGVVSVLASMTRPKQTVATNLVAVQHIPYDPSLVSPKIAAALQFGHNQWINRSAYRSSYYCPVGQCCVEKGKSCNERAFLFLDLRIPDKVLKKDPGLRIYVTAYSGPFSFHIKERRTSGWEYDFSDDNRDGIPDLRSFRSWRTSPGRLAMTQKMDETNRHAFIERYRGVLDLLPTGQL